MVFPTSLEVQTLPVVNIEVNDEHGAKTSYSMVLDYCAIAKAQEVTGKDLSKLENWFGLSGPDLSVIAWAGLDRYHPEVTLVTVRRWLAPAQFASLYQMLVEAAFPGITDRILKFQQDQEDAKRLGELQPNPSTVSA